MPNPMDPEVPPPGAGVATVICAVAAAPPPAAGVITVTCGVPAAATSAAAMAAVSCVALTNVVVRAAPFQLTVEPPTKLLPVTVSVKAALPADVLVGDRAARVGDELFTVNVCAAEVPPPGAGVTTVTCGVPAAATSAAAMAAVSWVALTNVVVRVAPFHLTVLP